MPKFRSQSPEYRLFFGIYVRSREKLRAKSSQFGYMDPNFGSFGGGFGSGFGSGFDGSPTF